MAPTGLSSAGRESIHLQAMQGFISGLCQSRGRAFWSSRPISGSSDISPSIETRSLGWRFGPRFTRVSTAVARERLRRTRRGPLDGSSDRHTGALLLARRGICRIAATADSPKVHQLCAPYAIRPATSSTSRAPTSVSSRSRGLSPPSARLDVRSH